MSPEPSSAEDSDPAPSSPNSKRRVVAWNEFCELVLSRRRLIRQDDVRLSERRLFDCERQTLFVLDPASDRFT